jgi:hypothetical protein
MLALAATAAAPHVAGRPTACARSSSLDEVEAVTADDDGR